MSVFEFSNLLYRKSITERDYLSAAFALYYAIRYKFKIASLDTSDGIEALINADDCVLNVCALVYAQRHRNEELRDCLTDRARELAANEDDFQRNWLFTYEALTTDDLPGEYSGGAWRSMKHANISFIDQASIDAPLSNVESREDALKALKELTEIDDESEIDRTEERATNEL